MSHWKTESMKDIREYCWPKGDWGGNRRFFKNEILIPDIYAALNMATTTPDYTALRQVQQILESSDLSRAGIILRELCKRAQGPEVTPVHEYLAL